MFRRVLTIIEFSAVATIIVAITLIARDKIVADSTPPYQVNQVDALRGEVLGLDNQVRTLMHSVQRLEEQQRHHAALLKPVQKSGARMLVGGKWMTPVPAPPVWPIAP